MPTELVRTRMTHPHPRTSSTHNRLGVSYAIVRVVLHAPVGPPICADMFGSPSGVFGRLAALAKEDS